MLTETHILDDRGPKTVLWWDGVPMMYAIRYSEGTVDISDISENDDLYPDGVQREKSQEMLDALVEWLILHDFDDMAGEWSEGEPQIRCTTNEHARVRFNARGGTIRWLKDTAANIKIWDGKVEESPKVKEIAREPKGKTVAVSEVSGSKFHIPKVNGRRYPAFKGYSIASKDAIVVGYDGEPLVTMRPLATEIAAVDTSKKDVATRLQHLAEAFDLGFKVRLRGVFYLLKVDDGYVASTENGEIAQAGELLPLGQVITVEAA